MKQSIFKLLPVGLAAAFALTGLFASQAKALEDTATQTITINVTCPAGTYYSEGEGCKDIPDCPTGTVFVIGEGCVDDCPTGYTYVEGSGCLEKPTPRPAPTPDPDSPNTGFFSSLSRLDSFLLVISATLLIAGAVNTTIILKSSKKTPKDTKAPKSKDLKSKLSNLLSYLSTNKQLVISVAVAAVSGIFFLSLVFIRLTNADEPPLPPMYGPGLEIDPDSETYPCWTVRLYRYVQCHKVSQHIL